MSQEYGLDLRMVILDAMQDDLENLVSIMRYAAEWRQYWPRDFTEAEIIATLRSLLAVGWLKAYAETMTPTGPELAPVTMVQTDNDSLRHYWFQPTKIGRAMWQQWEAPPLEDN